ncbi:MAG: flavin reductase family protein [Candidatus Eisenbacteria bacterium]|nr:flavin reductase family protein [Candidatus Eisenbacteria bacterium]
MKKSLGAKTLLYPTPVLLVGTYDKDGRPNLATVAWGGICCSQPPCVAVSLREATYTHGCILARRAFTVNVPSADQVKEADFCGMVSGRTVDKFAAIKFTPVKSTLVDAPYAEEFPLVLECRLSRTVGVGLHTEFIGEILDVKVDERFVGTDNVPIVQKIRPFAYAPGEQRYYVLGDCIGNGYTEGEAFGVKEE